LTVTFTLNGYQPESETIEPVTATGSPTQFRPNPVTVELTPAAPQPAKKMAPRKKAAPKAGAKSAAKPAARATPAPAPAASTAAPAQQSAPWPANAPR
jgi:hypothetical protein